jgi:CRISPR/Cas system Type II protein with McrA/HNH and RuvC-like nuclease domain
MRVQKSTDWNNVSSPYVSQMHSAPANTRKDLARMLGNVTGLVDQLGREEVRMRQTKRDSTPRQQELLAQIEQAIDEYEKWLMLAHLAHG